MTNLSRRYYERELGAGLGPSSSMKEHFGYSEPLRRFIQRESFEPQANEIPNTMPSWLPGDDYMTNFKVGDPYVVVDDGYAPLPGAGYEALHPELQGVDPEDYPDIHKLRILSDVAPYSREYNQVFPSCLTQKLSRACAGAGSPLGCWSAWMRRSALDGGSFLLLCFRGEPLSRAFRQLVTRFGYCRAWAPISGFRSHFQNLYQNTRGKAISLRSLDSYSTLLSFRRPKIAGIV